MKPISIIDSKVLAACTKFSHAVQRAVGLTNYFIAKIGIGFASIALVIDLLNYLHRFLRYKTPSIMMAIEVLMLFGYYRRTLILTKAEQDLHSGSTVKPYELIRFQERPWWRVLWLALFIADCIEFAIKPPRGPYWFLEFVSRIFFTFGITVFYYFVVVDPLPPGKSRVRAWIESFRRRELATESSQA